jgi:hypothetical protein
MISLLLAGTVAGIVVFMHVLYDLLCPYEDGSVPHFKPHQLSVKVRPATVPLRGRRRLLHLTTRETDTDRGPVDLPVEKRSPDFLQAA